MFGYQMIRYEQVQYDYVHLFTIMICHVGIVNSAYLG